jgi:hypothetical protein
MGEVLMPKGSDTQKPKSNTTVPTPRNGVHDYYDDVILYPDPSDIDDRKIQDAKKFVDEVIASNRQIKESELILTILQKLGIAPTDLSPEESTALAKIKLEVAGFALIAADFTDEHTKSILSNKYQTEVVETIGRERIYSQPLIYLLRDGQKNVGQRTELFDVFKSAHIMSVMGLYNYINNHNT